MLKDIWRVITGELSSLKQLRCQAEYTRLSQHNRNLAITIREMDQLIYNMSMMDSWDRMRPHFNKLNEGTEQRKQKENNRLKGLVTKEIEETYGR